MLECTLDIPACAKADLMEEAKGGQVSPIIILIKEQEIIY